MAMLVTVAVVLGRLRASSGDGNAYNSLLSTNRYGKHRPDISSDSLAPGD